MQTSAVGLVNHNNVPAFLMKLWKLVEDKNYDDLICWSPDGTSFNILDQSRFAKELLPLYFKHNNMASFVRQLNMYGFRKVVSIEQGSLRAEKDEYEFQHIYFMKGHEYLLELIKRKMSTGKSLPQQEEAKVEPQVVSKILVDMKQLHGKQENLDVKLSSMKSENEVLWREVANLRQQHKKQQQIVNRLIQFLLSLVHPKRSNPLGLRRKIPLMLNNVSHSEAKSPRYSRSFSLENNISSSSSEVQGISSSDFRNDDHLKTENLTSPAGPVIHDITDTFDAEAFLKGEVEAIPTITENSPGCNSDERAQEAISGSNSDSTVKPSDVAQSTDKQEQPVVGNDVHLNDLINVIVDEKAPSMSMIGDSALQVSDILVPVGDKEFDKLEFEDHLETLQLELDSLKDFLSGSGCTIDPVSLLGLFSNDDTASTGAMNSTTDFGNLSNTGNGIVGTEVAYYNPNNLGLGDDASIFDTDPILSNSLFECVDGIDDKPDEQGIEVSIPERIDESFFLAESNEDEKPLPTVMMLSPRQSSPLGIATAEIMNPESILKDDK